MTKDIKKRFSGLQIIYKYYCYLPVLKTISKIKNSLVGTITNYDFIIIDDYLPNTISAFRANEFSYLLNNVENSALYSIIANNITNGKPFEEYHIRSKKQYLVHKEELVKSYGVDSGQLHMFYTWTKLKPKLAYTVFLSNAYYLLKYFEKHEIDFLLELYPGGGFQVDNAETDEKLKAVLGSRYCAGVITTTKLTYKYILEKGFCEKEKVTFKYGVVHSKALFNLPDKKIRYPFHKQTIDICFTAVKYMEKGFDKGYDIFIDMAHILLGQNKNFRFHIVGGYNENDIEIKAEYRSYFHFYGFLKTHQFQEYYQDKDIFISPSRPFTLRKGAFDGFPTAACDEAALNGLCMVVSDPLDLNVIFKNGEDIVIVNNDPAEFAAAISKLTSNPEDIYKIGQKGKLKLHESDNGEQVKFRAAWVKSTLESINKKYTYE